MTPLRLLPPAAVPPRLVLRAPPSKSQALRALVAAALAGGGTVALRGPPAGDVLVLVRALERLGAAVEDRDGTLVVARGVDGSARAEVALDAGDGAAPARFLMALAATLRRPVRIAGRARLSERPMEPLARALRAAGARVEGGPGLPVRVEGPARGGEVEVGGEVSSQFASALLLAAPGFADGLRLRIAGEPRSRAYLELTREVMRAFGVDAAEAIPAGARYRPAVYAVEPDWSGATVLLAAAPLLGCAVEVPGLRLDSAQPDRGFAAILGELGVSVAACEHGVAAEGCLARGGRFDLRDLPDAAPALAALAAAAPEPVTIAGAPHLRLKESDRIAALVELLAAAGADASARDDGLAVAAPMTRGAGDPPLPVRTHGDHRIAMAAALLALRTPVVIDDADCVAKSFPGFFDAWPCRRETP